MDHMWTCRCCGQHFTELPLSMAFDAPDPWHGISDAERETRGQIGSDICIIDEHYFIRGCLDVPIVNSKTSIFSWGVWVSVSARSFEHIKNVWDDEVRDNGPAIFGWLCNSIPNYPETYSLKTYVHLRNHGIRPTSNWSRPITRSPWSNAKALQCGALRRSSRRAAHTDDQVWSSSSPANNPNWLGSRLGSFIPRCLNAAPVKRRPRGVRWMKPFWMR